MDSPRVLYSEDGAKRTRLGLTVLAERELSYRDSVLLSRFDREDERIHENTSENRIHCLDNPYFHYDEKLLLLFPVCTFSESVLRVRNSYRRGRFIHESAVRGV